MKTAAFTQGTLSIGWSLKSCRTTLIRTLKTSTPALNIFAPELPHERLNSATFRYITSYFFIFWRCTLHRSRFSDILPAADRGEGAGDRHSPFTGRSLHAFLRPTVQALPKMLFPTLAPLFLSRRYCRPKLEPRPRGRLERCPSIFPASTIAVRKQQMQMRTLIGTSLGWINEERRHRCNRNR